MRLKCKKTQIKRLFLENIIVGNKINKNIQKGISRPAGCIPEGLQWEDFVEGRIKKIDDRNDLLFKHKRYDLTVAKIG